MLRSKNVIFESSGRSSDLFASACIGLVALLPRLYVAIAWTREPVWDGHYYDFGARRIAAGLGYSDGAGGWHPWCHWPVGYSGLLAITYRLCGHGPHVATIFNAVTGALLAVFTHRLARYALSTARARVAGMLCALYPGLIVYSALVMTEPVSALALVVAGLVWAKWRRDRPRLGGALFGLCIGLGTLVHPSLLLLAPAPLLLGADTLSLPFGRAELKRSLAAAAISTACAFVPILPWTIRNCRVMDRCTLVSTNGGWNLAIGSFERATGRFETLRAADGCAVVTGQVQQDACWRDVALHAIRSDPGRWLGLVPKKLGFTFDHESFPVEYLHEADPDRWPEERRRRGRAWLTATHSVLLTFAVFAATPFTLARAGRLPRAIFAGLWGALILFAWASDRSPFYVLAVGIALLGWVGVPGSPPQGPVFRWALLSLLGTLLTHAVFFGEDRYHIVVTPMLCLLAAGAFRAHAEDTSKLPHPTGAARLGSLE
jgi:4-amino-4-deoxy-L-arabinose transferase-like glycosyltransferase